MYSGEKAQNRMGKGARNCVIYLTWVVKETITGPITGTKQKWVAKQAI